MTTPTRGRPPFAEGEARDRRVIVRLTHDEHLAAMARAKREGVSLSELVRRLLAIGSHF